MKLNVNNIDYKKNSLLYLKNIKRKDINNKLKY